MSQKKLKSLEEIISQSEIIKQIIDQDDAKKNFSGKESFENVVVCLDEDYCGLDKKKRLYLNHLNVSSNLKKVRIYCLSEFDALIKQQKILKNLPNHEITRHGKGYYKYLSGGKYPMYWIEIVSKPVKLVYDTNL